MAAFDWIIGSTIALLEFVVGEVGCEVDASWHAPVLQLHAATPYHSQQRSDAKRRLKAVSGLTVHLPAICGVPGTYMG
jgi:hypothetical protein